MARVNKREVKRVSSKALPDVRLAGGFGALAARQSSEALLRRAVMSCLLWEDLFYESGESVVDNIRSLIPLVKPEKVAQIAYEARTIGKMRHVPLLLAREMARLDTHKHLVGDLLPRIILRADELTEFLAIYWKGDKNQPLSKQVKIGLARAFNNFDEYQLAKYNRAADVKLRDVAFLTHVNPIDKTGRAKNIAAIARKGYARGEVQRHKYTLVGKVINGELETPDTWEVALSASSDKRATCERLISERKLGGLAFLRNLRNMENAHVDPKVISEGFKTVNPGWLLPFNYLSAAKHAPRWSREIEALMLRGLGSMPKLPGYTILVVDVSGSTQQPVSGKSEVSCLDAELAMAMLASEVCERVAIYATAGNDGTRKHATALVTPVRGFALADKIRGSRVGGGGIFTRQALEYIETQEREQPDRIIVLSDSQDCDLPSRRIPKPFGKNNYIINVGAHAHGVGYDGIWTAEISGFSEKFIHFIAANEGVGLSEESDNE